MIQELLVDSRRASARTFMRLECMRYSSLASGNLYHVTGKGILGEAAKEEAVWEEVGREAGGLREGALKHGKNFKCLRKGAQKHVRDLRRSWLFE